MDKTQYNVMLLGVPEHESLIFKLIFSVSLKSRVSSNAYILTSVDRPEMADILICNDCSNDIQGTYSNTNVVKVTLVNTLPGDTGDYLQRPLIATRVLSSLDQLISRFDKADNVAEPLADNDSSTTITPVEQPESTVDEIDEMDFMISEDEASELAIVDDESLMNPANVSDIATDHDKHVELEEEQSAVNNNDVNTAKENSASSVAASVNSETDSLPRELQKIEQANAPSDVAVTATQNYESGMLPNDMSRIERTPTKAAAAIDAVNEASNDSAPATTGSNAELCIVADTISNEISGNQVVSVGKALVVDDSASVRKQLELELALFDVDVDYAENADEAYQLLSKQIYDVAFLDVVLPDSDGFLICKSIKNKNKQTNVVMLTSKASPADKVKGSLAGCDDYLVKPVGRQTFQDATRKYLNFTASTEAMGA